MNAPDAELLSIQGQRVRVRCPYCSAVHEHKVRAAELGQTEHRAPGCGLYTPTTPEARATGYTFTTTRKEK